MTYNQSKHNICLKLFSLSLVLCFLPEPSNNMKLVHKLNQTFPINKTYSNSNWFSCILMQWSRQCFTSNTFKAEGESLRYLMTRVISMGTVSSPGIIISIMFPHMEPMVSLCRSVVPVISCKSTSATSLIARSLLCILLSMIFFTSFNILSLAWKICTY